MHVPESRATSNSFTAILTATVLSLSLSSTSHHATHSRIAIKNLCVHRVLDLRQTRLIPNLIGVLAQLPNVHLIAVSRQEIPDTIYPQWKLLREVDITQLPHDPLAATGVPQIFTPLHRERSLGIVLENAAFAGAASFTDSHIYSDCIGQEIMCLIPAC